jgi:membrane protease YdiL (CAAX protease family)
VFEEVGWTGFATPWLQRRYSAVTTGLIVGVIWGVWHLLQGLWIAGTYAGSLPVTTFITAGFVVGIAQLRWSTARTSGEEDG